MADIAQLPVMTATDAEAIGFARFNDVPTMPIDIPDGGFTISARTSEGRRLTLFFGARHRGGPARFVDIQYHDNGTTIANASVGRSPTFDMLIIGHGGRFAYDSRQHDRADKPSIAVILLDGPEPGCMP